MKSPDHPRPSGDRRIARLLIQALRASGHKVEIMSELRAWEGQGNVKTQRAIRDRGARIAKQLIQKIEESPCHLRPDIWFSYHLYHKAPDWIGPQVAADLQIPYVVAEASYAAKQRQGKWMMGLQQVVRALDQAAAIICLNASDIPALEQLLGEQKKLHRLMPFLDTSPINLKQKQRCREVLAQRLGLDLDLPWLISVAMMRNDAKLASYQQLAAVCKKLDQAYQLILIGDGGARPTVERLFSGELSLCTYFAGQLDQSETLSALTAGDIFIWPAINEAIGMAILEAQACGLPAVVGDSGAISDIVHNGATGYVCAPYDTRAMAERTEQLLDNNALRRQLSLAGVDKVNEHYSLQSASRALEKILGKLDH